MIFIFLQVRLYDTALQRRPAISVDFRNSPIKAVAADPNGHAVYIGTGTGDLASYDMRTGMIRWYLLTTHWIKNLII
jgi:ribosome biogenesis protein NSA1